MSSTTPAAERPRPVEQPARPEQAPAEVPMSALLAACRAAAAVSTPPERAPRAA
ncbi:hypothetical protein [Kitasatospora terrestris]|uniref:Uncharacterized protein n=1 Tax=Kitasatospora terrestris TaxID=258051 RepID=A0ABP9DPB2_9ACTN